jgi:DMSO/TMAO reductase YedYZ molybdopterin-dependent catalytic subunit
MSNPFGRLVTALERLAARPLPAPPARLRRGPLAEGAFRSALRSERLSAWLGIALAVAFGICFLTGLVSHAIQQPPDWFFWPSRPVNLYRVTQGLHVATGLALVPLLLVKLWSVYPKLFTWPPARDVGYAAYRLLLLVLVASALFQVVSGLFNIALWYGPLGFFFTTSHYAVAWIAVGAMIAHIGAKLPAIGRALRRAPENPEPPAGDPSLRGLSRRGLLTAVAAAAGVVTVTTAGQTVAPLRRLSVLAPRDPEVGPQGLPVNKSARSAGVRDRATDPAYRLVVDGPRRLELSLADLAGLEQHTVRLPITCVEGWSATATWTGVRIADLVDDAGIDPDAAVLVESLQRGGRYRSSTLAPPHTRDPLTLLALRLGGAPLALDHGYPCRLIAPNRPGVLQTKWVARIGTAR